MAVKEVKDALPGQFSIQLNGSGARYASYDSDELMTIQGRGNVGIGATTSLDELHGRGDNATFKLEYDDDASSFTWLEDASLSQLRISKTKSHGIVLFDLNPKPLRPMWRQEDLRPAVVGQNGCQAI